MQDAVFELTLGNWWFASASSLCGYVCSCERHGASRRFLVVFSPAHSFRHPDNHLGAAKHVRNVDRHSSPEALWFSNGRRRYWLVAV